MRQALQSKEPGKTKRIEEKLTYLQDTSDELLLENHRLKDELILSKKRHQQLFDRLIGEIEQVKPIQTQKELVANQLEEFQMIVRGFIESFKQERGELRQQKTQNDKLTKDFVHHLRTIDSLKLELENSKREFKDYVNNTQMIFQQKAVQMKNELQASIAMNSELSDELRASKITIQQLQTNISYQTQSLNQQIKKLKETHEKETNQANENYKRETKKLRYQYQEQKRFSVEKYLEIIQMKTQENEGLVKIIKKEGLVEQSALQGIKMIEYRNSLIKQLEDGKGALQKFEIQVDDLKDKLTTEMKRSDTLINTLKIKNQEIEKFKALIRQFQSKFQEQIKETKKLKKQIQKQNKYKEQQDKVLSLKWQQQLQKIAMDYQLNQHRDSQQIKDKYQQKISEQTIAFKCEVMSLKQKQAELLEKIQQLKTVKADLTVTIYKREQTIVKKEAQIDNIKKEMAYQISVRQGQKQELRVQIQKLNQSIENYKKEVIDLNYQINLTIKEYDDRLIVIKKQKQELIYSHYQQLKAQALQHQTEKHLALKLLRQELTNSYEEQLEEMSAKYKEELENLKLSRQLLGNKLAQQKQQVEVKYLQTIENMRKQERQMKWHLQGKLREERLKSKQEIDKLTQQIFTLKIDIGRQTKINEQNVEKIIQLNETITKGNKLRESLLEQITGLKKVIINEKSVNESLRITITEKEREIVNLKKSLAQEICKYSKIKDQVVGTRQDFNKELANQNNRHYKVVNYYKCRLKDMENYIVNKASQVQYLSKIELLQKEKETLDTTLVKCQAQLIKVRGLSEYRQAEIQSWKLKYKSLADNSFNIDLNSTVERDQTPKNQNSRKEITDRRETSTSRIAEKRQIKTANSFSGMIPYEKYSSSRKKRRQLKTVSDYTSQQTGLMNYSMINTLRHKFRLQSPTFAQKNIRCKTQGNL